MKSARLPKISGLAVAVPPHPVTQEEVLEFCESNFRLGSLHAKLLRPVFRNAMVSKRYASAPVEWYEQEHGWKDKNALFMEVALDLLERVAVESVESAGLEFGDIDTIVSVCSTGIAVPSLEARLMNRLPFRRNVQRMPMLGLGCTGGAHGLARANTMARTSPGSNVLLLVVELCTVMFSRRDLSPKNIVATAIFGDGAAAAVVSTDGCGPTIVGSDEYCWPNTVDILGWRVEDDGLGVVLSANIPALVKSHMREFVDNFLESNGLAIEDIDDFFCHPGGAKVLDALEAAFGLEKGRLSYSRETMDQFGNMSAATVLFILKRALDDGARGRHLLSGMGPGFSSGLVLLETP